jgi:hypothetical protein
MEKNFDKLKDEEKYLFETIMAARKIQSFLWGEFEETSADIEEFLRMFRKRVVKLDELDFNNPHYQIELKKRVMQIVAIGINFMNRLDNNNFTDKPLLQSNLPQYNKPIT